MEKAFDVIGFGIVAVDDLFFVERYPAPDSKVPIARHDRQCGGLTGTALVAASRLGARCAYAGVLGTDALSRFVVEGLGREGIDLSRTEVREGAAPVHSYIIVDEATKTRTILYTLDGVVGAPPAGPPERVVRESRVVFVDHWGVEGMIRAATIARDAGIPVVGDLERESESRFPELLSLVDHLIVSSDFARRLTGEAGAEQAVLALFEERRSTVVVTVGAEGCYYATSAARRQVRHVPAFSVDVMDTTGCGDVFHGAYAASLARGEPVEHRVAFATAAAALKATAAGGQAGIPTRAEVEAFLCEQE